MQMMATQTMGLMSFIMRGKKVIIENISYSNGKNGKGYKIYFSRIFEVLKRISANDQQGEALDILSCTVQINMEAIKGTIL